MLELLQAFSQIENARIRSAIISWATPLLRAQASRRNIQPNAPLKSPYQRGLGQSNSSMPIAPTSFHRLC
jgi:hypothetical protein